MKTKMRILSVAVLVALAPVAEAQTAGDVDAQVRTLDSTAANRGQTQVATRIAATFGSLAGSSDNTLALVNALRTGSSVTLTTATAPTTSMPATTTTTGPGTGTTTPTATGPGTGTATPTTPTATTTTITPPTGKMGWGNVFIALALAKTELANAGITNPTPDQLQAALTGGDVTAADGSTVTLKGVLTMRASGMGWGQIAQAEGTKLGPVVSSLKSAKVRVASIAPASATTAPVGTKASRLTTADDTTTTSGKTHGHGITTASGSGTSTVSGKGHGLTTAAGVASGSSSRGIVTAEGSTSTVHGKGNAYGRGVVTAAGNGIGTTTVTKPASAGGGSAAGLVTGSGTSATSVTTAQGAGGNGQEHGHGRGKGGG